jgi:hypothetical protein
MAANRRKKQASPIAEVGDVQEFASTIKQAWVECRSDGHSMAKHDVQMDENGTYIRTRRCRRCGYKRHYVISGGHILNATSEYPDGYLMPKGTGRLDSDGRAVFREAAVEAEYRSKANR